MNFFTIFLSAEKFVTKKIDFFRTELFRAPKNFFFKNVFWNFWDHLVEYKNILFSFDLVDFHIFYSH